MKSASERKSSSATAAATKPATPFIPKTRDATGVKPLPATQEKQKDPTVPYKGAEISSEIVDISSDVFKPSTAVQNEIMASGDKGLNVRVIVKGVTTEGRIKIRASKSGNQYYSLGIGSMPLINAWATRLGGLYVNFSVKDSAILNGHASLKPGEVDKSDWLHALQKNADLLGGLGLKIPKLPTPVNTLQNGKLTLGVTNLGIELGGFLTAALNLSIENSNKPVIDATADIAVKGIVKGQLKLDNAKDKLAGHVSLSIDFKGFSGSADVTYEADGTVDIAGKAAYANDKLSGEINFVATDLETANNFAKEAVTTAGGKENVQASGPPAPVPAAKAGKKERGLAAAGQLNFNLTKWFAGTVFVVVDAKGHVTVIGKIVPPGEIELFKQRDWDHELVKFEAKAYYGIPVVGNLNLFANISLHALASLGPAKIYSIEVLGTYSTDPEIQKSIQISGSINISGYAGLRLRAEGGAGIEIISHDLKFGVGLNADIGVKAYADARPTVGFRDPGEFFISGTLEMVAQPMLGLGGDFFIELKTPWWSPLSDDKWTWPLFSKEWPLTDPIGLNATVKDYVLGSGKVPEIELKKPEFDPSKFMTNMVDRKLPDKSGGAGEGHGAFKEDGSVRKPDVQPKKPAPKKSEPKAPKKASPPKTSASAKPDKNAVKEKENGKIIENAAKVLSGLSSKAPFTRTELDKALKSVKGQTKPAKIEVLEVGDHWSVTAAAGGKTSKPVSLLIKDKGKGALGSKKDERTDQKKKEDLDKAIAEATTLEKTPNITEAQIRKDLPAIQKNHGLNSLELVVGKQTEKKESIHIHGKINPEKSTAEIEIDKAWADSKSSVPIYGALSNGFGTSVTITSLTKDHPKGSGPSAEGGHWNVLRQRMDGGSTYYVRGHLLNDNLGGSGGEWRNLGPLTQATNNRSAVSMLHSFENQVKAEVASGNPVEFEVTLGYGRKSRDHEAVDEDADVADIIKAEKYVPLSVKSVAKKIGTGKNRTKLAEAETKNEIDTNLEHYATIKTPRKIINLNTADTTLLQTLNGVTAQVAKDIVQMRNLKDRTDLRIKLKNDALFHKIVSTAGVRIMFTK